MNYILLRSIPLALVTTLTVCGCAHYEPPKSLPDAQQKMCVTDHHTLQAGEWIAVLGGVTVAGSGIAYAASSSPPENVTYSPSSVGSTQYITSISACTGNQPGCDNARQLSTAVGAVGLGVSLLGLGFMLASQHAFDADGCTAASASK